MGSQGQEVMGLEDCFACSSEHVREPLRTIANAQLDPAWCDNCGSDQWSEGQSPATHFYVVTEFGGFYDEYRAYFVLKLCDAHNPIADMIRNDYANARPSRLGERVKSVTLNELKVLQVMLQ